MRDRDRQELGLRLDARDRRSARARGASASTACAAGSSAATSAASPPSCARGSSRADGRLRELVAAPPARRPTPARASSPRASTRSARSAVLGRGYAVCWNEARTSIIRSAQRRRARRRRPRDARRRRAGLPRRVTRDDDHRLMTTSIKDFESAIAELEKIVKQLEDGDLALDKSLALFERGVELSRYCHEQLGAAQRRIELLTERGELKDGALPGRSTTTIGNDDRVARRSDSRRTTSPSCAISSTPRCAARCPRRRRPPLDRRGHALRAARRRQAPPPVPDARGRRRPRAARRRVTRRRRALLALPRGVRRRNDPHLLARARRSAGDGRRRAAARAADDACRLRRRPGGARRRRPADRGVRGARAHRRRRVGAGRPPELPTERRLRPSRILAHAAGAVGMVGGQAIDLAAAGTRAGRSAAGASTRAALEDMHARKTGALIRAAARARRHVPRRRRRRRSPRSTPTRATSASRFRSSTTCSTSRDRATRSARPPARTRQPASRRTRALHGIEASRRLARRVRRARASEALDAAGLGGRLAEIADWSLSRHAAEWPAGAAASISPARRPRPRAIARARARADPRRRRHSSTVASSTKAGTLVDDDADVAVQRPDHPWVGRGGLKLAHALDAFGARRARHAPRSTSARRRAASPTCCCSAARAHVVALDVGHAQLDWQLRSDPRVIVIEGVNARHLQAGDLPAATRAFDLVTIDVSFISLRHILPAVVPLAVAWRRRSSRSSSRSSRPAATKSARAASCATPAVHARVVDEVARRGARGRIGPRSGWSRRRSPAPRATASSLLLLRRGEAR